MGMGIVVSATSTLVYHCDAPHSYTHCRLWMWLH